VTVTTTPSSPPRPAGRRRVLIAVVGCVLLVTLGAWVASLFGGMIDLRVYRMGGSVLLHGNALYDAELAGSGLPFTYPPFAAIAMVPLAAVPWGVALVTWTTISVLCITLLWRTSLTKTFWSFITQRKRTAVLVALTALSLLLEPVWQTIQFGQINLLLTAMILLDLVRPNDARLRGFWLGVAIGVKLTPLPFLALLVVTKQWRALRNAVFGLLATMAVGFAIVPHQSWRYWTDVILDANRVGGLAYTGNQSFNGFLHRLGNDAGWVQPTWFVLSVVFGLLVLWLDRDLGDGAGRAVRVADLLEPPLGLDHPARREPDPRDQPRLGPEPRGRDRSALLRTVRTALDLVGAVPRRPRAQLDLLAVHPRQLPPDRRHDRLHPPGSHQPESRHVTTRTVGGGRRRCRRP
jgi:alpha-1,2-mannosyltransferase